MRQRSSTASKARTVRHLATVTLALLAAQLTEAATLQEQLEQAVSAFGEGDYASSYWQFESMELDYGSEPEFLARNFQQTVLPVRGYAALMADRPTDALTYFGELLSQYDPHPGLRASVPLLNSKKRSNCSRVKVQKIYRNWL